MKFIHTILITLIISLITLRVIFFLSKKKNDLGCKRLYKWCFVIPFVMQILLIGIKLIVPSYAKINDEKTTLRTDLFDRVSVENVIQYLNEKQENQVLGLRKNGKELSNEEKVNTRYINSKNINNISIIYKEYDITYLNTNDADLSFYPNKITYGDTIYIDELDKIILDGYFVDKWTDSLGSKIDVLEKIKSDIELVANWDLICYEIEYDTSGGTNNVNNPFSYTVEDNGELFKPVNENYEFAGWYYNDERCDNLRQAVNETEKIKLTAKWKLFGDGTLQYPYEIYNLEQFKMIEDDLSKIYILKDNIVISNNYVPIGTQASPFSGTLLGNNKKITYDSISSRGGNIAIFNYLSGTVTNIEFDGMVGTSIKRAKISNFASLAINYLGNNNEISGISSSVVCYLTGDTKYNEINAAGIVAICHSGYIRECSFSGAIDVGGNIRAKYCNIGGIVARGEGGVLSNCTCGFEASLTADATECNGGGILGLRTYPNGTKIFTTLNVDNNPISSCKPLLLGEKINGGEKYKSNSGYILGYDQLFDNNFIEHANTVYDPNYDEGFVYVSYRYKVLIGKEQKYCYGWLPYSNGIINFKDKHGEIELFKEK